MYHRKPRNIGSTSLRSRRRNEDPMQAYDALPVPLRNWLAQAALPWSPASAKRLWKRARAKGVSIEDALQSLSKAEMQTLARDTQSTIHHINPTH